jgi:IS5 family transposase
MIGSLQHQTSLFYAAFGREAALIRDDLLDEIDRLLDDEELIDLTRQALARRHPRSSKTGRGGIAPDRLLRCCVLKHMKGWSLRQFETELRGSLVYRRFTRFDDAKIPDYSTFSRNFAALGDDLTKQLHSRVVAQAIDNRVAAGRKLRTDTTVVETNVHHPTDSALMADGIRVLTRAAQRIADACAPGTINVEDHARAAKHRVLEINRAAKAFTEASKERMKSGYSKLMGITRSVVRKAEQVVEQIRSGEVQVVHSSKESIAAQQAQLEHYLPLVKRVISQTKARVLKGNTHVANKVLSLFEPHTQAIRKGKAHKPTEFGRLVRIDEVENGIVSNYGVLDGNPADQQSWEPALAAHKATFGKGPRLATADRGFQSAANERLARDDFGVKRVALPARGPLSAARRKLQKQRWFQRAQGWRAGIEARIATLKHRFDMDRACYKGDRGFKRHVGWSVIANNLVSIARFRARRRHEETNGSDINQAV